MDLSLCSGLRTSSLLEDGLPQRCSHCGVHFFIITYMPTHIDVFDRRHIAHRYTVLHGLLCAGLFRQAGVKKLADFLARDFRQPAARAAAAKNAFVLLGQHRYDLAAVFFILSAICARFLVKFPSQA